MEYSRGREKMWFDTEGNSIPLENIVPASLTMTVVHTLISEQDRRVDEVNRQQQKHYIYSQIGLEKMLTKHLVSRSPLNTV